MCTSHPVQARCQALPGILGGISTNIQNHNHCNVAKLHQLDIELLVAGCWSSIYFLETPNFGLAEQLQVGQYLLHCLSGGAGLSLLLLRPLCFNDSRGSHVEGDSYCISNHILYSTYFYIISEFLRRGFPYFCRGNPQQLKFRLYTRWCGAWSSGPATWDSEAHLWRFQLQLLGLGRNPWTNELGGAWTLTVLVTFQFQQTSA